jgi:hypothetical protein
LGHLLIIYKISKHWWLGTEEDCLKL